MTNWILIWKSVLFIGIGLFACLTVFVIIGGYKDIQSLLLTLKNKTQTDDT